jgi:hypothetical protein
MFHLFLSYYSSYLRNFIQIPDEQEALLDFFEKNYNAEMSLKMSNITRTANSYLPVLA